jgi:hypothetical protein
MGKHNERREAEKEGQKAHGARHRLLASKGSPNLLLVGRERGGPKVKICSKCAGCCCPQTKSASVICRFQPTALRQAPPKN